MYVYVNHTLLYFYNDPGFTQCIYRYNHASKRFVEVYVEEIKYIYLLVGTTVIRVLMVVTNLAKIIKSVCYKNN